MPSNIIDRSYGTIYLYKGPPGEQAHDTGNNRHTPNENEASFLDEALEKLLDFAEGQLILGDFNIPLIDTIDRYLHGDIIHSS